VTGRVRLRNFKKTIPEEGRDTQVETRELPCFRIISGHDRVLAQQQILCELADRYGESGAMDHLDFYLSASRMRSKVPHLLLVSSPDEDAFAAVLLYQYRVAGFSTGIYMSSDFAGQRTVLAPSHLRTSVAIQAAQFLLDKGVLMVLLSVSNDSFSSATTKIAAELSHQRLLATQDRVILRTMELQDTYEATLYTMGKNTRHNFRRHTRKVDEDFNVTFVERPDLSEAEFIALNLNSAFPVSKTTALWRFREARRYPDSVFVGLRAEDGRWLCLLGGRRQGNLTDVDWQLNLASLQRYSLVTAMRAHLMQREIARGTRYLRFDGGTGHTMRFTFLQEKVSDLLLCRRFPGRRSIQNLLPRILPPDSLLGNVLRSEDLVWHS